MEKHTIIYLLIYLPIFDYGSLVLIRNEPYTNASLHIRGKENPKKSQYDLCKQAILQRTLFTCHCGSMLWRKEWSDSSWSATYGEFIEQTVTETCTFQHTRKFPMTSVL